MADASAAEKGYENVATLPVNNPVLLPPPKTRGIRPDGESGRTGMHPVKFLLICFKSSCTLSQYVNALWPVVDMNNALLSAILTGYAGFTSAAGHLGPTVRVDHDVSMLVPEIWCRMTVAEREPAFLIENGYLERVKDMEVNGRKVLASRLGYRITSRFVDHFIGRIFATPSSVFTEEMLRPEKQGIEMFSAGVDALVETQTLVARSYFTDGSVQAACPPLKALLHIMVHGSFEGLGPDHPSVRALFTREATVASSWYRERLVTRQRRDLALWRRHQQALASHRSNDGSFALSMTQRRAAVEEQLARVSSPGYIDELVGTIGADPFHLQIPRPSATG